MGRAVSGGEDKYSTILLKFITLSLEILLNYKHFLQVYHKHISSFGIFALKKCVILVSTPLFYNRVSPATRKIDNNETKIDEWDGNLKV